MSARSRRARLGAYATATLSVAFSLGCAGYDPGARVTVTAPPREGFAPLGSLLAATRAGAGLAMGKPRSTALAARSFR